ncbi:hypothetical protein [Nocardiopsis sp. CNR-923]|uniref:hypothetical protein n=1 Tax=Nocardiopsis sp. CNR-923 TaxID=1904965 RepID=UPI001650F2BE|nr:hypothetical protein [Nocardiopsis sp. CNR-923]
MGEDLRGGLRRRGEVALSGPLGPARAVGPVFRSGLTPLIADVLGPEEGGEAALAGHVSFLEDERDRLDRRMEAVRHTLDARRSGGRLGGGLGT